MNQSDRHLDERLAASFATRVPGWLTAWAKIPSGLDDCVNRRSDVGVFEQAPDRGADNVVNALVSGESKGSREPVFGLRKSQRQSLERFPTGLMHRCTMTETKHRDEHLGGCEHFRSHAAALSRRRLDG
jgi:hypothetical protein